VRGNQQLTAAAAILLLGLLAVEGVTLLNLRALMSVHAFVGMLLIPLVAAEASFIVWLGAIGIHVLAHIWKLRGALLERVPGAAGRFVLVGAALLASSALAVATLPAADHLQDHMSAQVGLDAH